MVAAVSLSIPIIAMTSLVDNRLPGTHDAYLHLLRLINAAVNLHEGVIIPRWGPQLHFGFGYPLGNFYAPGWHIAGAILVLCGLPAVTVWLLFQSLGLMLYPLGGYLFARLFTDRAGALLGAAAFLFIPIRFYEVFVQGNISQLIAMGLIAWVLWALARCALSPSLGRIVVAGVLIAAILLMHHPTSAYAIPFAALYGSVAVFVAPSIGARQRQIAAVGAAFVLGLLLSAAYWLPALAELRFVNVKAAANQYQLADNFLPQAGLLGPIVAPDHAAFNIPFTFTICRLVLGLTLLGGMLAFWSRVKASAWVRFHAVGGAVTTLVGLYLMTYHSLWIWNAIPETDLILFPWRLMGVVAAALVPSVVFVITALPLRWRAWIAGILSAGLFVSVLPLMFPVYDNEPNLGTVTPATSLRYEIESGNLGAVADNEYLPRWASERPDWSPCVSCYLDWGWKIFLTERGLPKNTTVQPVSGDRRQGSAFEVTTTEPFQLELRQMYFPGWQASIDGQPAHIRITEPNGLMAIDIPAGFHRVEFWYAGTTVQHVADGLTPLGLLLGGLLTVLHFWRHRLPPQTATQDTYRRLGITIITTALLMALVLRAIILPHTDWFRQKSDLATPAGMGHSAGIIFKDENETPVLELIGYSLSQDEADYGDWVFVDLYWRALTPIEQSWQVKLALADPLTLAEIVFSQHVAPGGFSTQSWATDQYVKDSYILRVDSPLPYVYDLVVHLFDAENEHLHTSGASYAILTSLRITEDGDQSLPEGNQPVDLVFGNWLRLRAYDWSNTESGVQLRLFWEVLRTPAQEFALMLHFQSNGETIGNADQPPIPSYPTQLWRKGQYLESVIDLAPPAGTDVLALGLYDRLSIQLVPVVDKKGGLETKDNSVLLPISVRK